MKYLREYMIHAYTVAQRSGDLSTQNGAVLVCPETGRVLSEGWNDLHPTFTDTPERRQRPLKYAFTEHAERSAILNAAKAGIKTGGMMLVCPWLACADCGRAIVFAGIKTVVRHHIPQHDERPDWKESIAAADQMFKEAGVDVIELTEKMGVSFRFCGQVIEV